MALLELPFAEALIRRAATTPFPAALVARVLNQLAVVESAVVRMTGDMIAFFLVTLLAMLLLGMWARRRTFRRPSSVYVESVVQLLVMVSFSVRALRERRVVPRTHTHAHAPTRTHTHPHTRTHTRAR